VTGGPVILNGLGQVVRVEAIPQPPVIDLAQEGLIVLQIEICLILFLPRLISKFSPVVNKYNFVAQFDKNSFCERIHLAVLT